MSHYSGRTLDMGFGDMDMHVTKALAEKGFGILAPIDGRETLSGRRGVEFEPFKALGAWTPDLAWRTV